MVAVAGARRPDRRRNAILGALAAVLVGGWVIANLDALTASFTSLRERGHIDTMAKREVEQRFRQGVVMLHARQFDNAAVAFRRVLELAPRMPEAHTNMGFALIGLEDWTMASIFFSTALDINQGQVNAYYGLGLALRGQGDREGALGAMRTYVHLAQKGDAHVGKAYEHIGNWLREKEEAEAAAAKAGGKDGGAAKGSKPRTSAGDKTASP